MQILFCSAINTAKNDVDSITKLLLMEYIIKLLRIEPKCTSKSVFCKIVLQINCKTHICACGQFQIYFVVVKPQVVLFCFL